MSPPPTDPAESILACFLAQCATRDRAAFEAWTRQSPELTQDAALLARVERLRAQREFDELLARARADEREALEALFSRLEERVLAMVRKRMGAALRGQFESIDILQSVMKDAYRDLAQAHGHDEDALLGWIAGLVEHKLANKARDGRRRKRDAGKLVRLDATATDGAPAPTPAAAMESPLVELTLHEELDALRSAIERLPQRWREVLLLRAFQRLEWAEVARRTGQTVKAAQSCFDRARVRLAAERAD